MTGQPAVPVLMICGASGVGKSSVSWEIYSRLKARASPIARIETDDLRYCAPVPEDDPRNIGLVAANIGAIWANFSAAGARCLVVSGCVDTRQELADKLARIPAASVTIARLTVAAEELRERIVARGLSLGLDGRGAVTGWDRDLMVRRAEESAASGPALDREGLGDFTVATDGRSVPEIASEVLERAGWPPLG